MGLLLEVFNVAELCYNKAVLTVYSEIEAQYSKDVADSLLGVCMSEDSYAEL